MNKKGFTLTEVLVTISIIAIMATIAIPSFISWIPKHRLRTSARQLYDDLNLAKMEAVKRNRDMFVTFSTLTEKYSVITDTNNNGLLDTGIDIPLRKNINLEDGVDISGTNIPGSTVGFNNRGMVFTNPGYIKMTNPTGIIQRISVITTGNISISTSYDGGGTWVD